VRAEAQTDLLKLKLLVARPGPKKKTDQNLLPIA